jgi:lipoprotein-anchoring transpeptidase ErfK/SrfK
LKQGIYVFAVLVGLVLAGACSAVALAGGDAPMKSPATELKAAPEPTFPARVRIAGVRLGGLDAASAAKAVHSAFAKPLPVVVDGRTVQLDPRKFATAYVATAVGRARAADPGDNVKLVVSVHGGAVRAYVAGLAGKYDRKSVPARLALRAGQPHITPEKPGRRLATRSLVAGIVHALNSNTRLPVNAKTQKTSSGLTESEIGSVILINRSLNRLTYFGLGQTHRFPVATGQAIYPTPTGRFHIVVKQMNPWWYPPVYDEWAKGLTPVPPGPSNPLGTRWMGLSSPGVGIHGTSDPSSIGYSVSHGCIRMQVPDAEWLFDHVGIGTTVFIV